MWMERLLYILLVERISSGPFFCNNKGDFLLSSTINKELLLGIIQVKAENTDLVTCYSSVILESYNIGRLSWRGSQTRAREEVVPNIVINLVDRLKKLERNKHGQPSGSIHDDYTDIRLIPKRLLSYSLSLRHELKLQIK